MRRASRAILICLLGLAAGNAWSASSSVDEKRTQATEELTVEGFPRSSLDERVGNYVRQMTTRTPYGESLVRWIRPICPIVTGFERDQAEYLFLRLQEVANMVGAGLAPAKCRPNLYIVATSEPDRLLELWRERDVGLFADRSAGGGPVEHFLSVSLPVRVWYNLTSVVGRTGAAFAADGPAGGFPTNNHAEGSRLALNAVRNMVTVIVVIDYERAKGVKTGALADYVAMTSLTQLDLDHAFAGAPTILALFANKAGQSPVEGLSAWDKAYLAALYHTDQRDTLQRSSIATRMVHDIAP